MNDLYRNEWRLLANLFLPSVKLESKHGDRAKLASQGRIKPAPTPYVPADKPWWNRVALREFAGASGGTGSSRVSDVLGG